MTKGAKPSTDAAAEWLPLDALVPHPKNPRAHGDEVTQLARTIMRTAWGAPIVAQWRPTGRHRVIAGHGRLLAARLILRGLEVDGEMRGGEDHRFDPSAPGPGLLPVRVVRVSDAEADAMTLADNAKAIQGKDDATLIAAMAEQFGRESALMADLGFDGEALDAMTDSDGDGNYSLELKEVDVSDNTGARFWLSVEGPLPHQPDVLTELRKALASMQGVTVNFVG